MGKREASRCPAFDQVRGEVLQQFPWELACQCFHFPQQRISPAPPLSLTHLETGAKVPVACCDSCHLLCFACGLKNWSTPAALFMRGQHLNLPSGAYAGYLYYPLGGWGAMEGGNRVRKGCGGAGCWPEASVLCPSFPVVGTYRTNLVSLIGSCQYVIDLCLCSQDQYHTVRGLLLLPHRQASAQLPCFCPEQFTKQLMAFPDERTLEMWSTWDFPTNLLFPSHFLPSIYHCFTTAGCLLVTCSSACCLLLSDDASQQMLGDSIRLG